MDKVQTPEFRVSFPAVFKPTAFENQEPKYKISMLFPKGTDLKGMKALAQKVADDKWPDKTKRPANLRNPFRDGDTEKPDLEGYAGCLFVTATSKMKPGVVDQNVQPIMEEGIFYAGCYARATVTAYAYNKAGNAGVAFGLQNVQKLRDGEEFSGRSKPEEDFDTVDIGPDEAADGGAPAVQESDNFLN